MIDGARPRDGEEMATMHLSSREDGDDAGGPRVAKLGGSLLELDDWPRRFVDWHKSQSPATTVLIVGGGKLADSVREYDRRFALGEEAAHWLSIRVLSLHAELAATLLGRIDRGVSLVRTLSEVCGVRANALAVFDPEPFLRTEEPRFPGVPLPHAWEATSDSIAARVAECLAAGELVLLKSAPSPCDALHGYVDGHFAAAAGNLRCVRFVDLRADQYAVHHSR